MKATGQLYLPLGIDLVIFDCDGVLVDSELICCNSLRTMFGKLGLELTLEETFAHFLGREFRAVEHFLQERGMPLPGHFRSSLREEILSVFSQQLQPIAGVAEAIARLPVAACVASSSDLVRVKAALGHVGLLGKFNSRIWTAEQVAMGKPAPDLFLLAASSMEVDPARTLVIEDSVSGVRAGRSAGMRVWGFVGGSHYRHMVPSLLGAGAELEFDDMDLLWPPDTSI